MVLRNLPVLIMIMVPSAHQLLVVLTDDLVKSLRLAESCCVHGAGIHGTDVFIPHITVHGLLRIHGRVGLTIVARQAVHDPSLIAAGVLIDSENGFATASQPGEENRRKIGRGCSDAVNMDGNNNVMRRKCAWPVALHSCREDSRFDPSSGGR